MPELPEVQTTVDHLGRKIKGQIIQTAWMDPRKPINTGSNLPWAKIARHLAGRRISGVTRRAKFIVINLDDKSALWVHQKMTGHLLVGKWRKAGVWTSLVAGPLTEDPMNRYIRLMLTFSSGRQLALSDARRFARVILVRAGEPLSGIKELARLGPEPLELSLSDFRALLGTRKTAVKPALTDPAFLAGIGNIYADEILHAAGVHPFSPLNSLTGEVVKKIHGAMRRILASAIRAGGSSTDDYRSPDGLKGGYQKMHKAYQRAGKPCTICHKANIQRLFRNGRSSHFCPAHQIP